MQEQRTPKTHRDNCIESKNKSDAQVYGSEVLTQFMERAWRRPVATKEVDPFVALFIEYRLDFTDLEEAMLEVLATVLATPEFLYLAQQISVTHSENSNTISDMELASRLSFFLWSRIPDKALLEIAWQGYISFL